ncbi:thioredoxin family protein [Desulfurella amilsii]|uniref:Thioredoxin family protein n=1 Tax=Desulfurella amilsii TaxID=1562698 RepID=A0A1X4XVJ4_9BACT|nr:TlpA disulfide reductase family protein [Desulfurella amilsii]OSS41550.1 thioredoxin family protein [Desulfurella amilsii]
MLKVKWFLLFLLGFVIASCSTNKNLDIHLNGENTQSINLSSLKGKVILINVFQTDCPACQEEIPSLNKLYDHYKNNNNVKIIGISLNSDGLHSFINYYKIQYPIYTINQSDLSKLGGIAYTPTTILIDKNGNTVERFVGARDFYFFSTNMNILL